MVAKRKFEDLLCWQKARESANMVYDLATQTAFVTDPALRIQVTRAAGSIMHNIAEGCDAGSDAEFVRFLKMARRSANEVQSQLYLASDRKYISEIQRQKAYQLALEVKRLINGLIGYLGKQRSDHGRRLGEMPAEFIVRQNDADNTQEHLLNPLLQHTEQQSLPNDQ